MSGKNVGGSGYHGSLSSSIPQYIDGLLVTGIGDYAYECNSDKNIMIPEDITYIGANPFVGN